MCAPSWARQDLLGPRDLRDCKESVDRWVCKALQDPLGHKAPRALRARRENKALREILVHRD